MWMLERFYDEVTSVCPDRSQIQPVNVTAAADWFYEGTEQEYWDFRKDFPCVALPFPYTWLEFKAPKTINSIGKKTAMPTCIDSFGCMCSQLEIPEHLSRKIIEADFLEHLVSSAAKASGASINNGIYSAEEKKARNRAALDAGRSVRWVNFWKMYCIDTRNRLHYLGVTFAYVDPDGQFVAENYITLDAQVRIVMGDRALKFDHLPLEPFLFATSLMHAKNVTLEANPLPANITRRRVKEGKQAITFKILQINPIRQQANKERNSTEQSAKRAMHIVRGHFKDYRNGGGLFGKLKGLYWWDMHIAGDISNGQIVKDYSIGNINHAA